MVEIVPHIALSVEAAGQICAGSIVVGVASGVALLIRKIIDGNSVPTTSIDGKIGGSQEPFLREFEQGFVDVANGKGYVKVACRGEGGNRQTGSNPYSTVVPFSEVRDKIESGELVYDEGKRVFFNPAQMSPYQTPPNLDCSDIDSTTSVIGNPSHDDIRQTNYFLVNGAVSIAENRIDRIAGEVAGGRQRASAQKEVGEILDQLDDVVKTFKESEGRYCYPETGGHPPEFDSNVPKWDPPYDPNADFYNSI